MPDCCSLGCKTLLPVDLVLLWVTPPHVDGAFGSSPHKRGVKGMKLGISCDTMEGEKR